MEEAKQINAEPPTKLEQVVIEISLDSSTDGYLASKQAAEIADSVRKEEASLRATATEKPYEESKL